MTLPADAATLVEHQGPELWPAALALPGKEVLVSPEQWRAVLVGLRLQLNAVLLWTIAVMVGVWIVVWAAFIPKETSTPGNNGSTLYGPSPYDGSPAGDAMSSFRTQPPARANLSMRDSFRRAAANAPVSCLVLSALCLVGALLDAIGRLWCLSVAPAGTETNLLCVSVLFQGFALILLGVAFARTWGDEYDDALRKMMYAGLCEVLATIFVVSYLSVLGRLLRRADLVERVILAVKSLIRVPVTSLVGGKVGLVVIVLTAILSIGVLYAGGVLLAYFLFLAAVAAAAALTVAGTILAYFNYGITLAAYAGETDRRLRDGRLPPK